MQSSKTESAGLSPALQRALVEFFRVAKHHRLSPSAVEHRRKVLSGELVVCPVSDKLYESSEVEVLQDQIGPVHNLLHPSLRASVRGLIPVVCIRCREVVGWLEPGRDRDGFVLQKGVPVHIHCCPKCEPEKFAGKEVAAPLIEKQLFLKYR